MHVIDPSGFEIYYGAKKNICNGVLGELDIDANVSEPYTRTPQENIYWEGNKKAPIGDYKVKVHLYNKRDNFDNIPFTVTIYSEKGEPRIFTDKVNESSKVKEIVCFQYTEEGIRYQK